MDRRNDGEEGPGAFQVERLGFMRAISQLEDPRAIMWAAVEMVGQTLGANRSGYSELTEDGALMTFQVSWSDGVLEPLTGSIPTPTAGGAALSVLGEGRTLVFERGDPEDPRTPPAWRTMGTRASISVPLLREGRYSASLWVHQAVDRAWTRGEIGLVEDVAARTWDAVKRARAEEALKRLNATLIEQVEERTRQLRESEERLKRESALLATLNQTLEQRVSERTAELEATQDALRQAQKMEALGQLTGGIAHDFNNLLAGISGSLELMSARLASGRAADASRYIETAQGAARRAAALTHRLLAFSRRQTLNPVVADVGALCRDMEDLLRRSIGPSIEMSVDVACDAWPIMIDDHQLENALLNLVINARDAMPGGGRLAIRIANRRLDEGRAEALDVAPGDFVVLSIADTGVGMTPDVIARAFDPFFTTKPTGQGTGLGLSMVYGFVRQSGGQVTIASSAGAGTTVEVHLPRHHGESRAEVSALRAPIEALKGDGRNALVVDDEPSVLLFIADVLRGAGYATIEAVDGASAMRIVESGAPIDLMVSDVGLPGGLNGRQLADAALARRPSLKVLLVTGYAEAVTFDPRGQGSSIQILTKPFSVEDLSGRVHAVMASGA